MRNRFLCINSRNLVDEFGHGYPWHQVPGEEPDDEEPEDEEEE